MKDHVEIGHLTKCDASRVNRDQVIRLQIHTNVSNFEKASPKPYKLLKFIISFVKTVKSCYASIIWKKLRWKSLCLPILKSITEIIKILRVYMILGDAVSKLETFVWILNYISRSITWSLFTLEASYLVKWPNSTWSFMCWCQLINFLKFETCPSSLLNFGTANSQEPPCFEKCYSSIVAWSQILVSK